MKVNVAVEIFLLHDDLSKLFDRSLKSFIGQAK